MKKYFLLLSVLAFVNLAIAARLVSPFTPPTAYNYTCPDLRSVVFVANQSRLADVPLTQLSVYWGALVLKDLTGETEALDGDVIYGNLTRRSFYRGQLALTPFGDIPDAEVESVQLYSLYVFLVHVHNRRCQYLYERDTRRHDESLYHEARAYVVAMIQKITLYDWLPLMTGMDVPHFSDPGGSSEAETLVEFGTAMDALIKLGSSERVLYSDQNKELSEIPLSEGLDAPEQMHRILPGLGGSCTVITGMMRDPLYRIQHMEIDALSGLVVDTCEKMRTEDTPGVLLVGEKLGLWSLNASYLDLITECGEKQGLLQLLMANSTDGEILASLDLFTAMALEDKCDAVLGRVGRALFYEQLVHRTRDMDGHWFECNSDSRTGLSKRDRKTVRRMGLVDLVTEMCDFADNVKRGEEFLPWRVSDVDVVIKEQSDLDDANIAMVIVLSVACILFLAGMAFVFFYMRQK